MNTFKRSSGSNSFVTTSETKCYYCKKGNLCNNCFNPAHAANECKFRKCSKLHNTLLHIDNRFVTVISEPYGQNKIERFQELGSNEKSIYGQVSENFENTSSSSFAVESDPYNRPVT